MAAAAAIVVAAPAETLVAAAFHSTDKRESSPLHWSNSAENSISQRPEEAEREHAAVGEVAGPDLKIFQGIPNLEAATV